MFSFLPMITLHLPEGTLLTNPNRPNHPLMVSYPRDEDTIHFNLVGGRLSDQASAFTFRIWLLIRSAVERSDGLTPEYRTLLSMGSNNDGEGEMRMLLQQAMSWIRERITTINAVLPDPVIDGKIAQEAATLIRATHLTPWGRFLHIPASEMIEDPQDGLLRIPLQNVLPDNATSR